MGVCKETLDFFNDSIKHVNAANSELIEFGDQDCVYDPRGKFRDMMKSKFKNWRSLDLHKRPGVELLDLSVISNDVNCADIITNFGTIEHVEFEQGQYNAWVNAHRMLRVNGVAIHVLPSPGTWINHCRYYYAESFYKKFESYGYKIYSMKTLSNELLACTLFKYQNTDAFMSFEDFFSNITFVATNTSSVGGENNPKGLKL